MTRLVQTQRVFHVIQGTHQVAAGPDDVLTTVLGSCVSICLHDRGAGVGGMNHFLLPGDPKTNRGEARYGINAMELLINGVLKAGARASALEAKVFGGANATGSRIPVGALNAEFAFWFLENEGIPCVARDVGGVNARKLRYWPHTGQVQVMLLAEPARSVPQVAPPAPVDAAGEADLFV